MSRQPEMAQPLSEAPGGSEPVVGVESSSDVDGIVQNGVVACTERHRGRKRRKIFAMLWPCFRLDAEYDLLQPERYNRRIEVYCRIDGSERRYFATARFDTQCSINLVSASWLRAKNIDPLRLERITDGPERVDRIEGSNELVARVSLWWYGEDIPYRDQQVHLKERTLSGDFAVAEPGKGFDIIIGQESIREERLFQKEWYFYAQTTQGGHIPRSVSLNAQERQAAEEARRRQRALQEQARLQRVRQDAHPTQPRSSRP